MKEYQKKILEMAGTPVLPRGKVTVINVEHEVDCDCDFCKSGVTHEFGCTCAICVMARLPGSVRLDRGRD